MMLAVKARINAEITIGLASTSGKISATSAMPTRLRVTISSVTNNLWFNTDCMN